MVRPPVSSRTQRYVRARARANMLGVVQIIRAVKPTYDAITLLMTAASAQTVYEGAARIYAAQASAPIYVGEGIIATTGTIVSLPYDAAVPKVDDIVVVVTFGSDPALETDTLLIKDVGGGGLIRATRQLACVAYQANRWWES